MQEECSSTASPQPASRRWIQVCQLRDVHSEHLDAPPASRRWIRVYQLRRVHSQHLDAPPASRRWLPGLTTTAND
jgi:hypothetical protein